MKTILVPTEQNTAMESALDCALLLAKKRAGDRREWLESKGNLAQI